MRELKNSSVMKLLNLYDVLILAVSLGAALIFSAIFYLPAQDASGGFLRITVNGEEAAVLPLSVDISDYTVVTSKGENVFEIIDGTARIIKADCLDRLCVRSGSISRGGELLVCLPHGVVAEVTGAGQLPELDAVTR